MIKIKKMLLLCLSIILFCSTFLVSCNSSKKNNIEENITPIPSEKSPPRKDVTGELKVHFLNLESAECILIQQGEESMIIDAGNENNESTLKRYLDEYNISKFKYAIVSHPHNNHIGSMDYIINNYEVENFYMPKVSNTTKAYDNLIKSINNKKLDVKYPNPGESFKIGHAICTILAPNSTNYEDLNDYSIVIKIEFGNNSFLFAGDAEGISESEMLLGDYNLKSDVLKISNSGSKTSTSNEFLSNVKPNFAVISVGADNEYGYPHVETINKLKKSDVDVYRTDKNGTIIATSDGDEISFSTKLNNKN